MENHKIIQDLHVTTGELIILIGTRILNKTLCMYGFYSIILI